MAVTNNLVKFANSISSEVYDTSLTSNSYFASGGLIKANTYNTLIKETTMVSNALIEALKTKAPLVTGTFNTQTSVDGGKTIFVNLLDSYHKTLIGAHGDGKQLLKTDGGEIQVSAVTVGSTVKPVYLNAGTIAELGTTIGSGIKPIYLNAGAITESAASVGSGVKPVYLNSGTITESGDTVGAVDKPVYLNAGTITVSNANIGAVNKPIYMLNGQLKDMSGTAIGSGDTPIYMTNQGVLSVCTKYAGGTSITLNGVSKAGLTATFYAPESLPASGSMVFTGTSSGASWAPITGSGGVIPVAGDGTQGTIAIGVIASSTKAPIVLDGSNKAYIAMTASVTPNSDTPITSGAVYSAIYSALNGSY